MFYTLRFSALQRAENSSISVMCDDDPRSACVSVLFSEPKIPQCRPGAAAARAGTSRVSVLFSEPKIPQFLLSYPQRYNFDLCFSALQRAENSSMIRFAADPG